MNALQEVLEAGTVDYEVKSVVKAEDSHEMELLKNMVDRLELKEKRAKAAYMDGIDSLEEYKQNKLLIQKERETLTESLKQLEAAGPEENADSGSQERQMLDHIRSVTDILRSDRFSALQKNVALRSIVDRIVFHKDTMHIDVFYYLKEQSREQDPRKPA